MSTYQPLSRWVGPILFACLAVTTACGSSSDADSNVGGAPSGGMPGASGGSAGSANVAGSVAMGGSATGGSASQAGAGGTSSQAGATAAGGTSSGGSAGSSVGGAGGASGSAGSAAAGASSGGSGGASSTGFTLTSPAWTAMAGCAADMAALCPVFPKENIATQGGGNKSPELDWTEGPSGTQSYAIVLQDLTNITGGKPFVHWAMWNIPGATRMLPAGLETTAMPSVPAGSSQKSFSGNGYQGSGKCGNVYEFVLYALTTATYAGATNSQTAVRDGLVATGAPTATLRAKSGEPGCTP